MTIKRQNEKFYLYSDDGYIIHSENDLNTMYKWCADNFLNMLAKGKIIFTEV